MTALDIVLVEDNDDHARLLEMCLNRAGRAINLRRYASGEQALAALLGGAGTGPLPDLVLMDINMPGIDGIEATRRLKSAARTCRVPVVILTTSSAHADLCRALDAHANSVVVKSVDFPGLRDNLSALVHYWSDVHLRTADLRRPGGGAIT